MEENKFDYSPWKPPFRYNRSGQWIEDSKGNRLMDVRGWGFLTGKGALAMDENEAAKIQDTMGERVTSLMNSDFPHTPENGFVVKQRETILLKLIRVFISFPYRRCCKHWAALEVIQAMEMSGYEIPDGLAQAVSDGDDETVKKTLQNL